MKNKEFPVFFKLCDETRRQGQGQGTLRFHVADVTCPQRWLKLSELLGLFTNKVADEDLKDQWYLMISIIKFSVQFCLFDQ